MTALSPGLVSMPPWLCSDDMCPLTHYLEQQDGQSACRERRAVPSPVELLGAGPRGLGQKVASVPHVARSHADLPACPHSPACCVAHGTGAESSQYKVIALVLFLLQRLPPFIECQPERALLPSQPSLELAPPPHLLATHVCDL